MFKIDDFIDAMQENSPRGKYSLKDVGCKFMTIPLKVRIQRLESGIDELNSLMVLGSPRYQRFPGFFEELRNYLRFLLAKSKQVS